MDQNQSNESHICGDKVYPLSKKLTLLDGCDETCTSTLDTGIGTDLPMTESSLVPGFGPMRAGSDGEAGRKLPTSRQATSECSDPSKLVPGVGMNSFPIPKLGPRCSLVPGVGISFFTAPLKDDDRFSLVPGMNAFLTPPKVGDVLKQAGCFVLGEIQTITIPETGGEWNLYPFPNDKRKTCAMLSAPPGVVASGKTVELTYGVIPSGPFVFPDGLKLVSVLIYLDCNDEEKLQKPLSLSLKHCITGDDEVLQNSLCFVKASHTPQDGSFVFKPKSDAVFDSKSGTLEFTDFCLKGICVKEACEEIKKVSTRCYAIPCQIQLHPTSRVSFEYRICLVFGLPTWEKVFREHYCTHIDYHREIHLLREVEFKANERIQSYVNETDRNGNGWKVEGLDDESVEFTDLTTALLDMREMKCKDIIDKLKLGLIFPHVGYVITHQREPDPKTHGHKKVLVRLRGCKDVRFPIPVREVLPRRTPDGEEDGEESSLAVQQSPIGGFVPPGTFGNGFLDWTPSDAGLLEVVDKIKLGWRRIAIYLGVPLTDVEAFESDHDLGGLRALRQWRDGREGCRTPSTWNTLFAVVKDKLGVGVHADLEREVMTHEHWSIRKKLDFRGLVPETIS